MKVHLIIAAGLIGFLSSCAESDFRPSVSTPIPTMEQAKAGVSPELKAALQGARPRTMMDHGPAWFDPKDLVQGCKDNVNYCRAYLSGLIDMIAVEELHVNHGSPGKVVKYVGLCLSPSVPTLGYAETLRLNIINGDVPSDQDLVKFIRVRLTALWSCEHTVIPN